jgi:hypothetical protein
MTVAIKNYIFRQFFIAILYIRPHEPPPAVCTILLPAAPLLAVLPGIVML